MLSNNNNEVANNKNKSAAIIFLIKHLKQYRDVFDDIKTLASLFAGIPIRIYRNKYTLKLQTDTETIFKINEILAKLGLKHSLNKIGIRSIITARNQIVLSNLCDFLLFLNVLDKITDNQIFTDNSTFFTPIAFSENVADNVSNQNDGLSFTNEELAFINELRLNKYLQDAISNQQILTTSHTATTASAPLETNKRKSPDDESIMQNATEINFQITYLSDTSEPANKRNKTSASDSNNNNNSITTQPRVRNINNWIYINAPHELVATDLIGTLKQNNYTINGRQVKREVGVREYVDISNGNVVEGCNKDNVRKISTHVYFGTIRVIKGGDYLKKYVNKKNVNDDSNTRATTDIPVMHTNELIAQIGRINRAATILLLICYIEQFPDSLANIKTLASIFTSMPVYILHRRYTRIIKTNQDTLIAFTNIFSKFTSKFNEIHFGISAISHDQNMIRLYDASDYLYFVSIFDAIANQCFSLNNAPCATSNLPAKEPIPESIEPRFENIDLPHLELLPTEAPPQFMDLDNDSQIVTTAQQNDLAYTNVNLNVLSTMTQIEPLREIESANELRETSQDATSDPIQHQMGNLTDDENTQTTTTTPQPHVRNINNWVYHDDPTEIVSEHLIKNITNNNYTINGRLVQREVRPKEYVNASTGDVVEGCNSKTKERVGKAFYFNNIRVISAREYIDNTKKKKAGKTNTSTTTTKLVSNEHETNIQQSEEQNSQLSLLTPNSANYPDIFTTTFSSLIANSMFPASPARIPGEDENKTNSFDLN